MAIPHSRYHESGTVTVDENTCEHCGRCAAICPADVLEMVDGRVRVKSASPFGCIACGHCAMVCPEGSITVSGRGMRTGDLIPLPAPASKASADALEALMISRRSIRRFSPREVEPDVLDRIVHMAATAPMGIPPWDIGIARVVGRDPVRSLAGEVVNGYRGFLRLFRPWTLTLLRPIIGRAKHAFFRDFVRPMGRMLIDEHQAGRDGVFWDAPALLIFHHSPYADAVDAAIAATYAMLAAESLGLGSTIIGTAPPILVRRRDLCRTIGIPPGNKPALAMILGYPAVSFRRGVRRRFTHENPQPNQ